MTAAHVRGVCQIWGLKPPEEITLYPKGDFEAVFDVEGKIVRIKDYADALTTMADWDRARWRATSLDITTDVT